MIVIMKMSPSEGKNGLPNTLGLAWSAWLSLYHLIIIVNMKMRVQKASMAYLKCPASHGLLKFSVYHLIIIVIMKMRLQKESVAYLKRRASHGLPEFSL